MNDMQRTLAILKPDCVRRKLTGRVLEIIEKAGFKIIGMKMIRMTQAAASGFYEVHKGKPFFSELINFMTEGPCVLVVLEKDNAVEDFRTLMGATNPEHAAEGTIRKEMAENISRNVVHGSDSPESAEKEVAYFFSESELNVVK